MPYTNKSYFIAFYYCKAVDNRGIWMLSASLRTVYSVKRAELSLNHKMPVSRRAA